MNMGNNEFVQHQTAHLACLVSIQKSSPKATSKNEEKLQKGVKKCSEIPLESQEHCFCLWGILLFFPTRNIGNHVFGSSIVDTFICWMDEMHIADTFGQNGGHCDVRMVNPLRRQHPYSTDGDTPKLTHRHTDTHTCICTTYSTKFRAFSRNISICVTLRQNQYRIFDLNSRGRCAKMSNFNTNEVRENFSARKSLLLLISFI